MPPISTIRHFSVQRSAFNVQRFLLLLCLLPFALSLSPLAHAQGTPLSGIATANPARDSKVVGHTAAGVPKHFTIGSLVDVYNVKHYGATGNGSADDTSAIAAAIAAAPAGSTIYFPVGTYLTNAPLAISKRLTLSGYGATIKKDDVDVQEARLTISASGVTVLGLAFDGLQSGGSGTPRFEYGLIDVVNSTSTAINDIVVAGCRFLNSRGCGLRIIGNVSGVEYRDNLFENNFLHVFAEPDGTYAYHNLRGHHNRYRSTWYTSTYSGSVKCKGDGANSLSPTGLSFSDESIVNSAEMGIELFDTIKDSSVVNCSVDGPTFGISLDNCANITVLGNKVYRNSYCGIELANQTRFSLVKGNTIDEYESDGTTRGGQRGIVSSNAACYRNVIEGNIIRGVDSEGIYLADNHHITIRGNFVSDSSSLINVKNSSYIAIESNQLDGPCNYHVFLDYNDTNSTDIAVTGNTLRGTAANDNIIIYSGVSGRVVTNVSITDNDCLAADFTGASINISGTNLTTPNRQVYGNRYLAGNGTTEFSDFASSPEKVLPYRAPIQRAGLSVAAKRTLSLASSGVARWVKVFDASYGNPIYLQIHLFGYNAGLTTKNASTVVVHGAPYGFPSGVTVLPSGDYFGGIVSEVVYNNPSSGAAQEVWLKLKPSADAITLDLYFSDYAEYIVAAPSATTTEPTWATNSYHGILEGDNQNQYLSAPSLSAVDRFRVGGGRPIRAMLTGYGTLTLGTINADAQGSQTLTVTGVKVADTIRQPVICGFNAALPAGIVFSHAYVSADNTVTFVFQNTTGGNIAAGSIDVTATVLRLIP